MTPSHDTPAARRRLAVGRGVRRRLASLVVILAVLVTACSTGVTRVDLAVLADEQEAWHGRLVEVTGTIQMFDEPRHHWIEDAEQHRVELLPSAGLDALVGRRVTVRGRFTFREGEGRRIAIQEIQVVDPAALGHARHGNPFASRPSTATGVVPDVAHVMPDDHASRS